MSKSLYVVAAMGLIGCVALSFMMHHLLGVKTERSRSPLAIELQELLDSNLDGTVEVSTLDVDGEFTMLVRLPARAGVPRDQLAKSTTDILWRRAPVWKETPERLRIEVGGPGNELPVVLDSRPPGLGRRSAGKPKAPAAGAPPK